jgi:hypothetical protein
LSVMRCWLRLLVGVVISMPATVVAGQECPNELKMFERDVRSARELKDRIFWGLAGANYKRRVTRYCAKEERHAGVAKLQLTPDEMRLLGLANE